MKKPQKIQWKEQYLRILNSGPAGPEDYGLAAELIENGYATGKYQISKGRETYGQVKELLLWAVTTEGRLFADQLAGQTRAARLRDAAMKTLIAIASAALGVAAGITSKALGGC